MSIDPVTTNANTGNSFNRYAYADNNPYRFTDPDGRDALPVSNGSGIANMISTMRKYERVEQSAAGTFKLTMGSFTAAAGVGMCAPEVRPVHLVHQ